MISKYKYILLDVDGVVLSSINYYLDLFRNVAESLGASKSIPNAFYKKNIGVKIITWMTNIVPEENHRIVHCQKQRHFRKSSVSYNRRY
jgi:beta-phosphoglucomutase-like phosphatase (HAD superfamily)